MKEVHETFTLAVSHHQGGQPAEAEALYRQVLETLPDCAAALNNLGLLVAREESLSLFHRAVAAEPEYVDALLNLSGMLYGIGDLRGADLFYQRALALVPERGEDLFRLARVLQMQGRDEDAILQYERALVLDPTMTGALCNLAGLHGKAKRRDKSAHYLRLALQRDPASDMLNHNMAIVLKQQGRLSEAAACSARMYQPQPLRVKTAPAQQRIVLLTSTLVGTVPTDCLLPAQTNTLITWQVDFATDEQEQSLPSYDVAFNIIGNADVIDDALPRLQRFHSQRPVLNSPQAVAQTRRDRLPGLLAGLSGVVVPPVLRVDQADLSSPDLPARLAEAGIGFPVLVRPIVGHGGEGITFIETTEGLAALHLDEADAYYVTAYHDYCAADGHFRKYRAIFVDGAVYAYHLAISQHWLVHYFSADMLAAPWKREEEARFLADPAATLGAETWARVAAIGERVGLDYAGADFSVLPDGRVLVFEANATMSVHLTDSPEHFPYKHEHVPAIFEAFNTMLDRHSSPSPMGEGRGEGATDRVAS